MKIRYFYIYQMLSNLSNAEQGLAYPISILGLIIPVKLDIYAHMYHKKCESSNNAIYVEYTQLNCSCLSCCVIGE